MTAPVETKQTPQLVKAFKNDLNPYYHPVDQIPNTTLKQAAELFPQSPDPESTLKSAVILTRQIVNALDTLSQPKPVNHEDANEHSDLLQIATGNLIITLENQVHAQPPNNNMLASNLNHFAPAAAATIDLPINPIPYTLLNAPTNHSDARSKILAGDVLAEVYKDEGQPTYHFFAGTNPDTPQANTLIRILTTQLNLASQEGEINPFVEILHTHLSQPNIRQLITDGFNQSHQWVQQNLSAKNSNGQAPTSHANYLYYRAHLLEGVSPFRFDLPNPMETIGIILDSITIST